jgi:hypothetical protein
VSNLNAALQLARRGFKVFPLAVGAKAPPLIAGWPEKATTDEQVAINRWTATPNANIGIHCEGLCVIDVDPKKGGDNALQQLDDVLGVPATLTTRTPSGGRHLFFRLPEGHRGVPNSVEEIGPGLDIRSTNGYVVAPGSTVPAGVYAFDDAGAEVAPAPQWLVDRLGVAAQRPATVDTGVPDAPEEIVERARQWLVSAERSVRGQGGDQAAFRVAARLRDLGVSYRQACELMRSDAWDSGCGWREHRLEDKPIRSAYRYATGEPGSKAAMPAEFPVVESSTVVPNLGPIVPKSGRARRLSEFANSESKGAGYVVKGTLQRASYAAVYGAPGAGKTFVTLDVSYHVAAERPWMDRRVRGGLVLYLAYEGAGGLTKRAQALRQKYGAADVPLYVVDAAFNLREQSGRQALGAVIAELPAKPVLIVIDTFARALMGGDENSAQDVGAFNASVAALIASTGACVLIVHHSGKDKTKGARGSSALLGALDTEIEVDMGVVRATKQRDVELGDGIGFKLTPVAVGIDEDSEPLMSCVVEPGVIGEGKERISGNAKRAFGVLCDKWPNNQPVDPRDWREACMEFLPKQRADKAFYDLKKDLLAKDYIEQDDRKFVTRRME